MSGYDRPDSRIFASYPMPAKIDLLNERPRRESQVERQLADQIGPQLSGVAPHTQSNLSTHLSAATTTSSGSRGASPGIGHHQQPQAGWSTSPRASDLEHLEPLGRSSSRSPAGRTEIKETRIVISQHSTPSIVSTTSRYADQPLDQVQPPPPLITLRSPSPQPPPRPPSQQQQLTSQYIYEQQQLQQQQSRYGTPVAYDQQQQQPSQQQQQQQHQQRQFDDNKRTSTTVTSTTTTTTNQQQQQQLQQQQQQQRPQQEQPRQPSLNQALNKTISDNAGLLALELAEKEARLMREITALHQRPYSPYQTPAKIDLTSESRASQVQQAHAPAPQNQAPGQGGHSRPSSRASNRSATSQADLAEKEARLLREIEEIEAKPYNPQTMLVEREQWFEYPEGRPGERQLAESRRRVRDFCSLPRNMCQERHVHEENVSRVQQHQQNQPTPGSIHTAILRSPKREVDNKSPLPFAFDNFTTKGVRGNIASANAVEPERPRAPIFPIVKRSPSPNVAPTTRS